jgi:hypothetical protein
MRPSGPLKNGLGDDPPEATHQVFEDCAFPPRHENGLLADSYIPSDRIEADVARGQDGPERTAWPPQQRLRTRDQFGHCKRLHEIVIGA